MSHDGPVITWINGRPVHTYPNPCAVSMQVTELLNSPSVLPIPVPAVPFSTDEIKRLGIAIPQPPSPRHHGEYLMRAYNRPKEDARRRARLEALHRQLLYQDEDEKHIPGCIVVDKKKKKRKHAHMRTTAGTAPAEANPKSAPDSR